MGKWKPLVASLVVVALGLGGLGLWRVLRDDAPPAPRPAPAPVTPTGITYEQVALDDREQRDPPYLWPDDGTRMSSPDIWVMWKTEGFSVCRLLATKDGVLWYDLGRTGSDTHYLPIDLARWEGAVTFAVDFTENNRDYRSKPRTVRFRHGAWFAQRRYEFAVSTEPGGDAHQLFHTHVRDRDPGTLGDANLRYGWFPESITAMYAPQPGDAKGGVIYFGVQDRAALPRGTTLGFFEVYDNLTDSWDRTLIAFKR